MAKLGLLFITLFFVSCSTKFYGDAHVTPRQCQEKCHSWGMVLDGMVAMGDYSDACICAVKRSSNLNRSSSAVSAGAIGVILSSSWDEPPMNSAMYTPMP